MKTQSSWDVTSRQSRGVIPLHGAKTHRATRSLVVDSLLFVTMVGIKQNASEKSYAQGGSHSQNDIWPSLARFSLPILRIKQANRISLVDSLTRDPLPAESNLHETLHSIGAPTTMLLPGGRPRSNLFRTTMLGVLEMIGKICELSSMKRKLMFLTMSPAPSMSRKKS